MIIKTNDVVYLLIKVFNKMIGDLSFDTTTVCRTIPIYKAHKEEALVTAFETEKTESRSVVYDYCSIL